MAATALALTHDYHLVDPTPTASDIGQSIKRFRANVSNAAKNGSSRLNVGDLISGLSEIAEQTFCKNWDGYDAQPIRQDAFARAQQFIEKLPIGISSPEIIPEVEGSIGFQWRSNGDIFVVSVDERGPSVFAGLIGGEEIHGTCKHSSTLSDSVLPLLRDHFIAR